MTDRAIAVGDLVQIVRARTCCAEHTGWGKCFRVAEIHDIALYCCYCKTELPKQVYAFGEGSGAEIHRLKRIPPLDELESLDHEHKLDVRQPA